MGNLVKELNDPGFDSLLTAEHTPALLDFWGPSCGPCKALEPMLEQLAARYLGRIRFFKINVDECPQTALRFAVKSLPTLLLIKDGQVLDQYLARISLPEIDKFLQRVL